MSEHLTIRQLLGRFEVETQGEFRRLVSGLGFPKAVRGEWLLADIEAFERDIRARVAADPPPILNDNFDDLPAFELPALEPIRI
jgi:hypothetical protein